MTLGTMATDVEQRIDFDAMRKYRLQRARDMMEKHGLGALVCFDNDNIRYITNTYLSEWTRGKYFRWCVLPREGEPRLHVDIPLGAGFALQGGARLVPGLPPRLGELASLRFGAIGGYPARLRRKGRRVRLPHTDASPGGHKRRQNSRARRADTVAGAGLKARALLHLEGV